jgi:hypothetical protein
MRPIALLIVTATLATAAFAAKKPAISEANQAELQTVRTVFIDGNSEAADKLREKMEIYTCLKVGNNKAKADAVMAVDESARNSDSALMGHDNKVSASVVITMPNGDQVWSKNKLGGEGFVHSGAGTAAVNLLRALAKDACPDWKLRNEGGPGTPFHKDYVRPDAQKSPAAPTDKQ